VADESVEVLLERIQRHLDAKQGQAPPAHAAPARSDGSFSDEVYDRLEEADVVIGAISVQPFLSPRQIPIIGGLWQRVRLAAHQLVVFYVNRLAGAQGAFNREIAGAVTALVHDLDRGGRANPDAEVAALRAEVAALRADVDTLKSNTRGHGA
jgi:hypothetical protein